MIIENHRFELEKYMDALEKASTCLLKGKISQAIGLTLEASGPRVKLGELCYVKTNYAGGQLVPAEVVGFKDRKILLMPLGNLEGIGPGSELLATGTTLRVPVGMDLKGRVLNGLGEIIDDKVDLESSYPVMNSPNPLKRQRITQVLR